MTIPFLGKRKVYPTKKDLEKLLQCSDIDHPPSLAEMEQPTLNQLNELDTGSVAFIYEEGKTGVRFTENLSHNFGKFKFALNPEWRGNTQLSPISCLKYVFISHFSENNERSLKLEIVGWKGKASVRSYVPKNDRIHYLRLLGADTSKYEVNKFEVKREGEATTVKEEKDINELKEESERT